MTIPLGTLLRHYKRADVQEAMILAAEDKEIAVKYGDKGFGKRPDVLRNPRDILEFAKNGATSFHCSEELWTNPLLIETGQRKDATDEIRKGWDLILDIDCKELGYSQVAADLLVQALKFHDIESVTVKFSGNHGFHIAVPFEAFPEEVHGVPTSTLFPEGPRRIAMYLKDMIAPHLASKLLAMDPDINTIALKAGVEKEKLLVNGLFDPFGALAIDTILLASRHLYRMPYSFNEKSGLVSVPVDPTKIMEFDRRMAEPEKIQVGQHPFLIEKKAIPGEARRLIIQAFDFKMPESKVEKINYGREGKGGAGDGRFPELAFALQEDLFPPCIKAILAGMGDGKKRASFVLVNFLRSVGWDGPKIEERLRAWNELNKPDMLREQDLLAPLRYHTEKKRVMPPNCDNKQYYVDVGMCKPDNLCQRIKNPAQYSLVKARAIARYAKENEKKGRGGKKEKAESTNPNEAKSPQKDQAHPKENQKPGPTSPIAAGAHSTQPPETGQAPSAQM